MRFVIIVVALATYNDDTLGQTPTVLLSILGWSTTTLRLFGPTIRG